MPNRHVGAIKKPPRIEVLDESDDDDDCSARDWDGKDYLRIIPRVVW